MPGLSVKYKRDLKRTYIFDLDGTLLDTARDLSISFNYALNKFNYPSRTKEEFIGFVGNGTAKAIERAAGEKISPEKLTQIVEIFKEHYRQNMFQHTKPYNGIIEILGKIKSDGHKTAVVSNKFDDAVKILCKRYFKDLIDIAIGEGYGIRRKPEPDGINKVLTVLGSGTNNSIYIGDSDTDILTAKNAKIPCITVLWGFRDKEFLIKNGAKFFAYISDDIIKSADLIFDNI